MPEFSEFTKFAIEMAQQCGRFDAFWEFELHAWDIAAGLLLVQEAGGKVTQVDSEKIHVESPSILASNGKLHEKMMKVITEATQ